MIRRFGSAARRGLTLIELVVVIAILAVIAMMVIPRLDFLKAQAEHSTAAATAGDVTSMIQTFKSSSGAYPSFDLLVTSAGAIYPNLESNSIRGALTPFTVPGPGGPGTSWYRSFYETGFTYGYRHDTATTVNASDSGTQPISIVDSIFTGELIVATLTTGGSSTGVASTIRNAIYPGGAQRVETAAAIPDDPGTPENEAVPAVFEWQTLNPGVIPTGRKIVVFGIGPKSNLVGNIMTTAPKSSMANDDPTKTYCRYLAFFEIFDDGSPARLKLVTDHRGRQIGARVDLYKQGSAIN